MNRLSHRSSSLVLTLLLFTGAAMAQGFPRALPEEMGFSEDRLGRLADTVQGYVVGGKIPGAVTFLARDGRLVHLESFGHLNPETQAPMRPDAIFRIASMSKAVTSVAVLILMEEGRLLLEDPVSRYVPEFKEARVAVPENPEDPNDERYRLVPLERDVTLRHLLTQTAGISYGTGTAREEYDRAGFSAWYFAEHDETIGEAVRRLARLPFDAQPGERWVYGFATDILGHVVEVVSEKTLEEFFQSRIFGPLKMTDTHFYLPEEKLDRFTPVYGLDESGNLELVEGAETSAYFRGPRRAFSGGAGLLSTAMDYGRFLQMLLNGGELQGARLLSPRSVDLMTVNHVGDLFGRERRSGPRAFGLGFSINEHLGETGQMSSVGAYGWGGAYFTSYWVDPAEGLVALFMTQLRPARGLDLQNKFRTMVYQALIETRSGRGLD